ncbi:hypothetical protein CRYUN_Cryun18bG0134100 [Craigia yunnanensis]
MGRVDPYLRASVKRQKSCLKLLAQEEPDNLEIPSMVTPSFPVKRVMYISEGDGSYIGGNITLPPQPSESTRFNMFTGYQTIHQREQNYKVNETAVVHCGFYSENGAFKISDEDKSYMQTCQVVVSTCAFGGGDDLYQPIGMTMLSLRKVCYMAFWDEITLQTQEAERHKIDDNHTIGIWETVTLMMLRVANNCFDNPLIIQQLSDSKSQFRQDPLGVLEALLWRTSSVLAISEHGARSSICDEGKAVVEKHKATPEEVEAQLFQYRQDGFPNEKRFNGKKVLVLALVEASVIVREHTPLTNLIMCLWFNEVVRFTSRDQLSFPFVLRQLSILNNINLFPVCTRKELVNSMGHKRKARSQIS